MENIFISGVAKARDVRAEYGLDDYPVDIEKFCDYLGVKLRVVDFSTMERKVGKEISGLLLNETRQYEIWVNDNGSSAQTRFAAAHELGHLFLHAKADLRRIIVSFRGDGSHKESAANKFAAELLMPEEPLKIEYNKQVIPVGDSLARKFGVPKSEMCKRLDWLGLIYI